MDFHTEPRSPLPPGCIPDGVTSDGHAISLWRQEDGRTCFVWDDHVGEPFDSIGGMRDGGPAIFASDDDAHIAYQAIRGQHSIVGRDSSEEPYFGEASRSVPPVFSSRGEHLAYGVINDQEGRLVVDGQLVSNAALAPIAAVYSADGSRLAYAEQTTLSDGTHQVRVVVSDTPGPWITGMRNASGAMQFSPDSQRFAYMGIDGKGHGQWIVDGVAQQLFDESRAVTWAALRGIGALEAPVRAAFSPDSRRFVYFADVPGKGVAAVEDDIVGPRFAGLIVPVFSPDSKHLAYVAQMFDKSLALVVDGTVVGQWKAKTAGNPVFSPDGQHVALTMLREEGGAFRKRQICAATVDGAVIGEGPAEDVSPKPVFSPDGRHLAWWAVDGERSPIFVDGVQQNVDGDALSEPRFTSAGHLVYAMRIGPDAQTLVVDGSLGPVATGVGRPSTPHRLAARPGTPKDGIEWGVSADGEHIAWAGLFSDRVRPVLDNAVGPGFDDIINWSFNGDIATWYARLGSQLYTVTARS